MGFLFSKPKTPEPIIVTAPPPTTSVSREEANAAAEKEAQRLRKRRAATGTILTGPAGLTQPAPTLKTRLGE